MPRHFICRSILTILSIGFGNALAGQYVGFDLCKPATPEKVIAIMEEAGAKDVVIETPYFSDDPSMASIKGKDYPVATGFFEVDVMRYKGKIYGISIKDGHKLNDALEEKYGKPFKTTEKMIAIDLYKETNFHYRNPKDNEVAISVQYWLPVNTPLGPKTFVEYRCKSLEKEMLVELERDAAAKLKKKSTGKPL